MRIAKITNVVLERWLVDLDHRSHIGHVAALTALDRRLVLHVNAA